VVAALVIVGAVAFSKRKPIAVSDADGGVGGDDATTEPTPERANA
jgi:hypothetical protein